MAGKSNPNLSADMGFEEPDIKKIICKDCVFREKDKGKIKGATKALCEVFPDCNKPREIYIGYGTCPYYVGEDEEE